MIEAGLIAARFIHFLSLAIVFGGALFPAYAYGGLRPQSREPEALAHGRRQIVLWSAVVALLSGIWWFLFTTAGMIGNISAIADPASLSIVLNGTAFGSLWVLRLLIVLAFIVFALGDASAPWRRVVKIALAAFALASLAGTGHAVVQKGLQGNLHMVSDAAHLLAAGMWLGGLVPLGFALAREHNPAVVENMLFRFSAIGMAAVATIIVSGFINSWFLVGSLTALFATLYGQLLCLKLALFGGMVALAISNNYWIVPRLAATRGLTHREEWLARLRRHVLAEQVLGVAILGLIAALGTLATAAETLAGN